MGMIPCHNYVQFFLKKLLGHGSCFLEFANACDLIGLSNSLKQVYEMGLKH